MQRVREEDSNLYFNAKSSWRWCEFCAHPRVILYADRTGAETSDIRMSESSGHTLFRISSSSECRRGERLILSRYLGDVHPFHHLITTQHSAYIVDERFPCVPMLKVDHMMESPPLFCHTIPSCGGARTAKVLLGSHSSQEVTLLQYSGGRAEACSSRGPPQALLRPRDSLKHLPVQIPHRLDTATTRLSSPAAGLTCVQKKAGGGPGGEECLCVLQLTEAGDIFYQILEPEQPDPDTSRRPAADQVELLPQQAATELPEATPTAEQLPASSQLVVSDTSSDDDGVIGPTQRLTVQRIVPETPERRRRALRSQSSSGDSEDEGRRLYRKHLQLEVVVNDDADAGVADGNVAEDEAEEHNNDEEEETLNASSCLGPVGRSQQTTPVPLSSSALITWKRWLQKLMRKSCKKKPRPHRSQHFTVETEDLLHLSDNDAGDSSEKERVQSLRRDLRSCMSRRSLLVNSALSTPLRAPDAVPVPNQVDTKAWPDPLSHRLTASWQGEEAWRAWWDEELGTNKEAKAQALRRRRKREKEAKRAAGRRLELSGSFTSSLSYQSDLDDFSSSGWSSAASQGAGSDVEDRRGPLSQLVDALESDGTVQTDATTPTATPQTVKGNTQTPSRTRTPSPESTPASQRRDKRRAEDDLSSLFASQEDPSQPDVLPESRSSVQPPHAASTSSPSQLRSSQPLPLKTLSVNLSRDIFSLPGSSQSLPPSQSSQGRPSQAKKKKPRMGF